MFYVRYRIQKKVWIFFYHTTFYTFCQGEISSFHNFFSYIRVMILKWFRDKWFFSLIILLTDLLFFRKKKFLRRNRFVVLFFSSLTHNLQELSSCKWCGRNWKKLEIWQDDFLYQDSVNCFWLWETLWNTFSSCLLEGKA